jgi:hypothetical protein
MNHKKGSARQQRLGKVGRAVRTTAKRKSTSGDFGRYEALKASLTVGTTTPAEYEAACRRAAKIAGV